MEWLSGPIQSIGNIPAFWISRIAKILQLTSGLVILIEIFGKDRVEKLSYDIRKSLDLASKSGVLKNSINDIVLTCRIIAKISRIKLTRQRFKYEKKWEARKLEEKLEQTKSGYFASRVSLLMTIPLNLFIIYSLNMTLKNDIGDIIALFVFGYWIYLFLLSVLYNILLFLYIFGLFLESIILSTLSLLNNKELSKVLTIMSLFFLIVGFLLDIAVS